MGKHVSPEQSKGAAASALNEIIYSDNDIIASLDSQLRGGTEDAINRENESSDNVSKKLGLSAPIDTGIEHVEHFSSKIMRSISPHDSKIINLVSELGIDKNKETESFSNGQIVLLDGSIRFFDVGHIKHLFKLCSDFGMIDELKNTTFTEADQAAGFMIGKSNYEVIDNVLEFLPPNPLFVLRLKNAFAYALPLQESCLRYPLSILNWTYGSGLKGDWSVLGIYNASREKRKPKENPSALEAFQQMNDFLPEVTKSIGLPGDIITPILIYRKLTFSEKK
jgi:hypothetical protein